MVKIKLLEAELAPPGKKGKNNAPVTGTIRVGIESVTGTFLGNDEGTNFINISGKLLKF